MRSLEIAPLERLVPEEGWQGVGEMSVNMVEYRLRTPFELREGDMLCL